MFIQTEPSANTERMKFIPGRAVLENGTAIFADEVSSKRSPLAQRLFEIDGVTSVFLDEDAITVSKSAGADWQVLKPFALSAIMVHYGSGEPIVLEDAKTEPPHEDLFDADADPEIIETIKELIETRVKPAVTQQGGDVIFRGFKHGVVFLEMSGAATGLRPSIEQMLRHFLPEISGVADFSDAVPKPGLESEDGKAIRKLFDERINPQVASHGGHIALVDVQGDTVYLRLEGGCQGCGMADVTLKQGVANEIKALVPTIVHILDVTDHAGGSNPYYQPGKGG